MEEESPAENSRRPYSEEVGVYDLLRVRAPSDHSLLMLFSLFIVMIGLKVVGADPEYFGSFAVVSIMLIVSVALLILAADFFVTGAKCLARRAGIAEIIIGLTIVSIGTSLPEIMVTGSAAMKANAAGAGAAEYDTLSDLAIGNIYGSVLVQISLILGIVVLYRPLDVRPSWLGRDGLLMVLAVMMLTLLLFTGGELTRIEGAGLATFYLLYLGYLIFHREKIREEEGEVVEELRSGARWTTTASIVMVVVGLALAVYASNGLIGAVLSFGEAIGLEESSLGAVLGTSVSAVGTSLPELTVALLCARKSQGVAIGALIGSNITDPLLSVGIAAMIHPLSISSGGYFVTTSIIIPATLFGVVLCVILMWTDFRFNRTEGIIMILLYLLFLAALAAEQLDYIPFW